MSIASREMKVCVTCSYYNGPRKPQFGFVEYDSALNGKCYQSFPQGIEKTPMTGCTKWEIWAPLKK